MKTLRILMVNAALLAAYSAAAHTELAESVPADGAMISAAPQNVQLRFSEPVRLTALSVQAQGAQKNSLGPLPSDTAESFTVALPALEHGQYVVAWRALSQDTHVMTGEFSFALGAMSGHGEHTEHAAASTEHAGHMDHAAGSAGEHAGHMDHAAGSTEHAGHDAPDPAH